jgi:hypothetical protein
MPDTEPDEITLTCTECGAQITGAPRGKGSATWKMGTHRYTKHGLRGEAKPKRTKANADDAEQSLGASPVLGIVRDIADGAGRRAGPPTSDDLAKALGRGVTLTTLGMATLAVETDPHIAPGDDSTRDWLIDKLTLPEKAAHDVMRPVGRLIAPTGLNKRYGRGVVENVDVLGSFFELVVFTRTWAQYMRERNAPAGALPAGAAAGYQPPAAAPALYSPPAGYVPTAADLEGITTPPPQAGVVLTPTDIERLQRGG